MKNVREKPQDLEFPIKYTLLGKENGLKCATCSRLDGFISPQNLTTVFKTGEGFP